MEPHHVDGWCETSIPLEHLLHIDSKLHCIETSTSESISLPSTTLDRPRLSSILLSSCLCIRERQFASLFQSSALVHTSAPVHNSQSTPTCRSIPGCPDVPPA